MTFCLSWDIPSNGRAREFRVAAPMPLSTESPGNTWACAISPTASAKNAAMRRRSTAEPNPCSIRICNGLRPVLQSNRHAIDSQQDFPLNWQDGSCDCMRARLSGCGFAGSHAGAKLLALQADQAFETFRGQIERRLTRIHSIKFRAQEHVYLVFNSL
jgi:hypothetical protein